MRQGRLAAEAGVDVRKRQVNADGTKLADGMQVRVESVLPGRATDPGINAALLGSSGGLVSSSFGVVAVGSAGIRPGFPGAITGGAAANWELASYPG